MLTTLRTFGLGCHQGDVLIQTQAEQLRLRAGPFSAACSLTFSQYESEVRNRQNTIEHLKASIYLLS